MNAEMKLRWIYRAIVVALLGAILVTERQQLKFLDWISDSADVIEDHTDPDPPYQ